MCEARQRDLWSLCEIAREEPVQFPKLVGHQRSPAGVPKQGSESTLRSSGVRQRKVYSDPVLLIFGLAFRAPVFAGPVDVPEQKQGQSRLFRLVVPEAPRGS